MSVKQGFGQGTLSNGILAYYKFDGDSKDYSGLGHDGTGNAVTYTTDRLKTPNGAMLFDGKTSFVQVPYSAGLSLVNSDYNISYWVKKPTSTQEPTFQEAVISNRVPNELGFGYLSYIQNNSSYIHQVSGGTDPYLRSTTTLVADKWTHISVNYNFSTQILKMYVDGKYQITYSDPITFVPKVFPTPKPHTKDLFIGKDTDKLYFLEGALDEIHIYGRELSDAEIQTLAQIPPANLTISTVIKPTTLAAGAKVSLQATVTNVGNLPTTAPTDITYYLSQNQTYEEGDINLGTASVPVLKVDEVNTPAALSPPIPGNTALGNYYILAIVNQSGSQVESTNADNLVVTPVTVTNPDFLLAYYKFDGDSKDYSGMGNNGTGNAVNYTTDRYKTANGAMSFDGKTSFVQVPYSAGLSLVNSDYNISYWVKKPVSIKTPTFQEAVVSNRVPNQLGYGYLSYIQNNSSYIHQVSGGTDPYVRSSTTVVLDKWTHISVNYIYASRVVKMYVDGKYETTYRDPKYERNRTLSLPLCLIPMGFS